MANYVYVIGAGHQMHKIGVSTNPNARIASLQTGSPFRMKLAFTKEVEAPYDIETRAHIILAPRRMEGEWFDVDAELAIRAVHKAITDRENGVWSSTWTLHTDTGFSVGCRTVVEAHSVRAANADFYRRVMLKGKSE